MSYQAKNPCNLCEKTFFVDRSYKINKQKFCSASCRVSHNNSTRVWAESSKQKIGSKNKGKLSGNKNPNYKGGGLKFLCKQCQVLFEIPKNIIVSKKHSGQFCSQNCLYEFRHLNRRSSSKVKANKEFGRVLSWIIKNKKRDCKSKWFQYVDFTVVEFIEHFEKKFKNKMNWDNYGEWHIDHIKPISFFDYNNENDDDFKQCWALKNLQPLWALENLKKSGMNKKSNRILLNGTQYKLSI